MLCIYKGSNLTIEKTKSRSKDKNGNRGKYVATLTYKPMSEKIRKYVKATDIHKLIAENEAKFMVKQQEDKYTIYYNSDNKIQYAVCDGPDYFRFLKRLNLISIYSSTKDNITTHYLK